jgi:hypothetical protein
MRTRHRIPSVFNISMVDVLCCALGCVILLWLLNSREAKTRARLAGVTRKKLLTTEARLNSLTKDLEAARYQHAAVKASLARQEEGNRRLQGEIAELIRVKTTQEAALARGQAQNRRLAQERKSLVQRVAALKRLRLRDEDLLRNKAVQIADLEKALAASEMQKEEVATSLARRTAEKRKLEARVRALDANVATAEARVMSLTKEQADLLRQRRALRKAEADTLASLRQRRLELHDLEKQLDTLRARHAETERRLRQAEAGVKSLHAQADLVPGLRTEIKDLRSRLSAGEDRALRLEQDLRRRGKELRAATADLDDAHSRIEGLRQERVALSRQVRRVRAAAAERFAGIALTGRRVIFLVDMSGSMELVDRKTVAPAKWIGVRETVAKILRSLPDVEKFQIISFARDVRYPLGRDGRWLAFDTVRSVPQVTAALAKIKPSGGTNMYAGFREAFRFRAEGMDTLYVLSDGLPNLGEAPIGQDVRKLKGSKRALVLSKYIRRQLLTRWNRPESGRRVRINTVGFFYESPDVGSFLWALARENDGSFVGMSTP